jgi:hypothetical protein
VSLTHSFQYEQFPRIDLIIHSLSSGLTGETDAIIDTGAEFSIFDMGLAQQLEIDFARSTTVRMEPIGGSAFEAMTANVRLSLLLVPELTLETTVLFAPNIAPTPGNLIGLDVLQYFDIAISHSQRTGLIGPSS